MKRVCKSGDMCCCCKKKELIPRVKSEEEQNQIFEVTKDILDSMPCCVCHNQKQNKQSNKPSINQLLTT